MITETRPNVNAASRYSVAQACALLGISRSTLRRHTERGFIRSNRRKSNGRPFYTGLAIMEYWEKDKMYR